MRVRNRHRRTCIGLAALSRVEQLLGPAIRRAQHRHRGHWSVWSSLIGADRRPFGLIEMARTGEIAISRVRGET